MKITYLVSVFPRLSETFVLGQITELIKRGHEVDIISINRPTEELLQEDVHKYKLLEKTQYLSKSSSVIGFDLNEQLISSLFFTDIIHAHFAGYPADWARKVSKMLGIPFVITAHAYDIYINPDVEGLKEKFQDAAKVITISNYNNEYLSRLLNLEIGENVEIIRCGIDLEEFKYIQRNKSNGLNILYVGRLVDKKGINYAVEAFNKVVKDHNNVELRIIGDGPLKEEVVRLIYKLNLNDKIRMLGALPQSAVINEMAEADIFFLPSMTAENGDSEGIPVSIIEASATGLPIVSTMHTGIPEIVLDGKTGFLTQEKDTAAMAERLKELILDPELRIRMGKAGRAHVESHYDRKMETDHLIKLFTSLLGEKSLISDIHENRLGVIRERIHNLGIMLSELDNEIRIKVNEIAQMNRDLNQKNEQIRYMQERFDNIERQLAYKIYTRMASILKKISDSVPR